MSTTSTTSATDPALADRIRALIAEELPSLIDLRHDLHAHPELGYEEHRTSEVIQRELKRLGITFKAGVAGGTGVVGSMPGAASSALALRADIDALPIEEQNDLPYRSVHEGRMHACGHDGHTTMLVGAARVLSRLAETHPLPNPVTLLFQPAEEGGAGGRRMVEDGCLTGEIVGPPVRAAYGLHGWPEFPVGVVGTRVGALMAASDRFEIHVRGVGGHAAWPHATRDPITAAAAIVQSVQTIVSRNVGPLDSAVVSITMLQAGTAFNIIPETVRIAGTVRTLRPETQSLIRERLGEIAESIPAAHGCSGSLDYRVGYPATVNDPDAVATFDRIATAAVGTDRVRPVEAPVMGGEDFAYYGQKVPACFFVLGLIPEGEETMPSLHHPQFNFNDDAISTGVELFVNLALSA